MFEEVDLATLAVVHAHPHLIGEVLCIATVSSVGVAIFGGVLSESFPVDFIELGHEFFAESLEASCHGEEVHGGNVLNGDGKHDKEHPEERSRVTFEVTR